MPDLLPCPFCGTLPSLDEPTNYAGGSHYYHVTCEAQHCPVQPDTAGQLTAVEAAAAWNTRPILSPHPIQ